MPIGIRISPAGIDAEKAAIKDLVYSSEADSFKVHKMGFTAKAKATDLYIDHDLRYKPFFWAYFEDATDNRRKFNYAGNLADTNFEELKLTTPNSAQATVDILYYIFLNLIL